MADIESLANSVRAHFGELAGAAETAFGELTVAVDRRDARQLLEGLRDHPDTRFEQLIDLCAVDYSKYGDIDDYTREGGVVDTRGWEDERFAVVYHLLSLTHNHRIRVAVKVPEDDLMVDSVIGIWPCADWFEREAFDLFGIVFDGHPDLRRILTDYGFIGHPFRKDFPLWGTVEMRYDAERKRVVYEPVTSVDKRILVPRVIREEGFGDRNP